MNAVPTPGTAPGARSTQEWQAADSRHFLHPFTDFAALAQKGSRIVERGEGIYLWDTEGQRVLDAMSGLWCVNVGYGRRELIEAATSQLERLAFYNAFFQTATPPAIELAELLAEVTPPQFQHVFFSGSGSEGNDTVVRMVRRYWDLLGQPERKVLISRNNAYHGSTMAGASLGGMAGMHAQGGLPIPDIAHIEQPYWYELGRSMSRAEFGTLAASWLEAKILELGPERVAAFVGEPVQGAGGVIIPPETYWPAVQAICDKYGILLVSDEVICGFGRTGRWFGCEHFGIEPDFMTIAKGITSGYQPLGGAMVSDKVANVLIEKGGEFAHGFTWSGHPVCCAVAIENLNIMRREKIVDRAREEIAPYLQKRIRELADHRLVGEVRGVGMLGAIELVAHKGSRTFFRDRGAVGLVCRDHCFKNGLIMRAVRDTMILAPPLVMTREDVDELVEKARRCIDLTARDIGVA